MEQSAQCGSMSCWEAFSGSACPPGRSPPWCRSAPKKVGGTLETIKSMLIGSKVANFDETGTDVNGKTIWVHNSSTSDLTYQTISTKRGQIGMEGNGVLTKFGGIAVHDCWSPYWKYDDIHTQFAMDICCAN